MKSRFAMRIVRMLKKLIPIGLSVLVAIYLFWAGLTEIHEERGALWENRITGSRQVLTGPQSLWRSPVLYRKVIFPLSPVKGAFTSGYDDGEGALFTGDDHPIDISLSFEILFDPDTLMQSPHPPFGGNLESTMERAFTRNIRDFFGGYTAHDLFFRSGDEVSKTYLEFLKRDLSSSGIEMKSASLDWAFTPASKEWLAARVSRAGRKVIMLGIDGLEWRLLDEWMPDLPNFRELISCGTRGELRARKPLLSPPIWTEIATGMRRERHGILHFVTEDLRTGKKNVPCTSNMRRVKAFWNIAGDLDLSVGVLGWLISWPAEKVNGFIVSSYIPYAFNKNPRPLKGTFVPDLQDQTYPPRLMDEISPFKITPEEIPFDERRRFLDISPSQTFDDVTREYIDGLLWSYAADETYRKMGKYLLKRYSPRIFGIYFGGVDVTSHRFWKYLEPEKMPIEVTPKELEQFGNTIRHYYRHMDRVLGDFLEYDDDSTYFMVISDHGFEAEWRQKKYPLSGWHRNGGVFILKGPGVKEGSVIEGGESVDVTPTILYALDCPVSREMDGGPIVESFSPEWRDRHPLRRITTYETAADRRPASGGKSSTEREKPIESTVDRAIEDRLRAIGYIE